MYTYLQITRKVFKKNKKQGIQEKTKPNRNGKNQNIGSYTLHNILHIK